MNLFRSIKSISSSLVLRFCEGQRLEVDLDSAKLMKLSPAGEPFRFLVRFDGLTPGGDAKQFFVQVNQEANRMVARLPFINFAPSFDLAPFQAKWFAPQEKSQAQVVSEALYQNWFGRKEQAA